ncbi:MAG TPA: hypothetical protein VJL89_08515, partial [Thermodesulfovibrionia bacterium]|nr:hypothetical protein [Thermodesulfovibrionia bacterium]
TDFKPVSPQPEVDILAVEMPDILARKLQDKKIAEIVSREKIEEPDLVISGSILHYWPAKGLQNFQSPHALLNVEIEAKGKNSQGKPVGYTKVFNFQNSLPSMGLLMSVLKSVGVLTGKILKIPYKGLPSETEDISREAVKDIERLLD